MKLPVAPSFAILADDLSGAVDCTNAFIEQGVSVSVSMRVSISFSGDDVIAWDLDTRRLSAAEAEERVASCDEMINAIPWLYKKIDSTLRGNWVSELNALTAEGRLAIVAPAFPAAGRTVVDGEVRVHGVPLKDTETWQLEHGHLSTDMVARCTDEGIRARSVSLAQVREGGQALCDTICDAARQGINALVCDSETDSDLYNIGRASIDARKVHSTRLCWAGSGGLAAPLAQLLFPMRAEQKALECGQRRGKPFLGIIGSLSSVTKEQVRYLQKHRGVEYWEIPLAVLRLQPSDSAWQSWHNRFKARIESGADLLLGLAAEADLEPAQGPYYAKALAQLAREGVSHAGALFVTGGETARAMLSASGIEQMTLVKQIAEGMALGQTESLASTWIMTKPGAFGQPETLAHAYDFIRNLHAVNEGLCS